MWVLIPVSHVTGLHAQPRGAAHRLPLTRGSQKSEIKVRAGLASEGSGEPGPCLFPLRHVVPWLLGRSPHSRPCSHHLPSSPDASPSPSGQALESSLETRPSHRTRAKSSRHRGAHTAHNCARVGQPDPQQPGLHTRPCSARPSTLSSRGAPTTRAARAQHNMEDRRSG